MCAFCNRPHEPFRSDMAATSAPTCCNFALSRTRLHCEQPVQVELHAGPCGLNTGTLLVQCEAVSWYFPRFLQTWCEKTLDLTRTSHITCLHACGWTRAQTCTQPHPSAPTWAPLRSKTAQRGPKLGVCRLNATCSKLAVLPLLPTFLAVMIFDGVRARP